MRKKPKSSNALKTVSVTWVPGRIHSWRPRPKGGDLDRREGGSPPRATPASRGLGSVRGCARRTQCVASARARVSAPATASPGAAESDEFAPMGKCRQVFGALPSGLKPAHQRQGAGKREGSPRRASGGAAVREIEMET